MNQRRSKARGGGSALRLCFGALVGLVGGCSLLFPIGGSGGASGGVSDGGSGGRSSGVASSSSSSTSSSTSSGDGAVPCTATLGCGGGSQCMNGRCCTQALPVAVLPIGVTCNLEAALKPDGMLAGLDNWSGVIVKIGSAPETGCAVVDFGSVANIDPVTVRIASIGQACPDAAQCMGTDCNTSDFVDVFAATSFDAGPFEPSYTLTSIATLQGIPTTLTDYSVMVSGPTRFIAVCRTGAGPMRDNFTLDAVWGTGPCQ